MADEPVTSPAAPVSDHRPVPRGVLPRRFQTWLMAGLAFGILLIILITGHPEPTQGPTQSQPAPVAPNPDRLRDYQERLRAMEARQTLQAEPTQPALSGCREWRNPQALHLRTRFRLTANVGSTKACSPATWFSAADQKQNDQTSDAQAVSRKTKRVETTRRHRSTKSRALSSALRACRAATAADWWNP